MFHSLFRPRTFRAIAYIRVASKSQLTPKHSNLQNEKIPPNVMIGNTPYFLPKQLMKPIYDYKSHFNAHSVLMTITDTSHNELKEL